MCPRPALAWPALSLQLGHLHKAPHKGELEARCPAPGRACWVLCGAAFSRFLSWWEVPGSCPVLVPRAGMGTLSSPRGPAPDAGSRWCGPEALLPGQPIQSQVRGRHCALLTLLM